MRIYVTMYINAVSAEGNIYKLMLNVLILMY